MSQKLTVVVTGSTGKQGGAVARALLERGHKVRAITRDPDLSQANSLAHAGASLVTASLEDTAALRKALEGATSLFAITVPFVGKEAETRQGIAAADAAKAAGVHLVFTSVANANRQDGSRLGVHSRAQIDDAFRIGARVRCWQGRLET
jgi:uncharacterized protein YbjT (DUF2867 family)